MFISASRRTDIPSYYSEWFFNRIKEGFVLTRNPVNPKQIKKINLSPNVVDGIVFWTKNPAPMLDKLFLLKDYMYYFQFTLTPYGKDIERNLPEKNNILIPIFKKLSDIVGPERIIWRYDPIIITSKYTVSYHIQAFEKMAKVLNKHTKKCTISFFDPYKKIATRTKTLNILTPTTEQVLTLASNLSTIAKNEGIALTTCAENINLTKFDITPSSCIDGSLFEKLLECTLNTTKDKNQRLECNCITSIDIGMYNTCKNGCLYCYANYSPKSVELNWKNHNPMAPLLFGEMGNNDIVQESKLISCKNYQLDLFKR